MFSHFGNNIFFSVCSTNYSSHFNASSCFSAYRGPIPLFWKPGTKIQWIVSDRLCSVINHISDKKLEFVC